MLVVSSKTEVEKMELCEQITLALRVGESGAVRRRELERLTGEDGRTIRIAIEHLRRGGVVICSGENGYFYPETVEELKAYIGREECRAKQIDSVLESARGLLRRWELNVR